MKLRAIVTGATGMVGEGVLLECLQNDNVEAVLIINRRPSGFVHPKLTEIIHTDFYDLEPIAAQLIGYNACFFCLGISSVGMKEDAFYKNTYTLTLHVAGILSKQNSDMTFCYVSGAGTDSTEKGKRMWARVKGKTENDLMKLPFKAVFNFRPAFMKATEGQKNTLALYKYLAWLYPLLSIIIPNATSTIAQVGRAMICVSIKGYTKNTLEVPDIKAAAASL